jgi:hypothetical protein
LANRSTYLPALSGWIADQLAHRPLADQMPESTLAGVGTSARQIEKAQEFQERAKLSNLTFHHTNLV